MRRLTILLCLLIILAGCQGQTRDERRVVNWRVGNMGLNMRFLPDLPPPRVYDDTELTVVLEVNNMGATPVGPNDRIYLSGFDPAYITGISTFGLPLEDSEGKTSYNIQGTTQFATFQATPIKLSSRSIDFIPINLLATVCYNYQTVATENVCVDLDPFSPTIRDKVCRATPASSGTQGGPVAVSRVDVDPSPGRTRFTVYVSNVGNGNPFPPGPQNMQKCSPYDPKGFPPGQFDMVRVNDVQVSGRSIIPSCKGLEEGNLLRLIQGQGKIFCDFKDARTTPAYITPLIVNLEYGYKTSIQTPVQLIASD